MASEFAGAAIPLAQADIENVAQELGVEPALIAAVAEVESAGAGFLPDKRPKILFEAHVFSRQTAHRYDGSHPNISSPRWDRSLYGASGEHQYDRLDAAITLNREAALESASWGRFQIMGFNAAACGFSDVEHFVQAMCRSEADHLRAFVAFCRANNLLRHLVVHDWRAFTRGYNGSGQVERYSELLETAYRKHADKAAVIDRPAEALKDVQKVLAAAGVYPPDLIDGDFGRRSRAALSALLRAAGQPEL